MPQADAARKAITKIPVRQSKRLRGYNMMVNFGQRERGREATAWLHSIHGDEATGRQKSEIRQELGYAKESADDEAEAMDPAEMAGGVAARFVGREHLAVEVTIEDPVRHGMPLVYLNGLSEMEFTATSQVAKDKAVVTRWEVHGKHSGELLGVPPTGKEVTVTGMTWVAFDEQINPDGPGRLSRGLETWTYWDLPSLAEQIGAGP
jgi:hypothetical protein